MKKLLSMLLLCIFVVAFTVNASENTAGMTRGETAKLIRQMLPPDGQQTDAVAFLNALGVMIGDGNGNLRSEDVILTQEAATMLIRMLGYESMAIDEGGYPNGYMLVATKIGIFKDINCALDEILNAEGINKMYENSLDIPKLMAIGYDASTNKTIYSAEKGITFRKIMAEYN